MALPQKQASATDLSDKYGLLIDDIASMRTTVRIQLASIRLERCDQARNIKEAIDRLTNKHYDLIVCDYNLGDGADGQQFLELVRRKQLLPLSTAFLMITGETAYQQVSTAAEYSPDDYLLKPFTAETLGTRLLRIIEKKEALKPVYQHMGAKGDRNKALAACEVLLAQKTRYTLEVLRIKGDLLLSSGRATDALALYEEILGQRSTPWAEVGKALALSAIGDPDEARFLLEQTLVAYPNYLAAYDSLADMLVKTDKIAAQQVVEQALKVASTTQRQRELGTLALDNKDYSRAEDAFRVAVERDRSGFFNSHDDYAGLTKSYVEQDKTSEAMATVKDMGQRFKSTPELAGRQAALECQVHARSGNAAAAQAALTRALALQQQGVLDATTSLEIAQACFASGRPDEAKKIIQAIAEDHQENEKILARAHAVFEAAGLEEEGALFLEATRKSMIRLNNEAVALAKSNELDKAILMLVEAADRLPNNAQVAVNAAQAILMRVQTKGMDLGQIGQAHRYITQAIRANPQHPKLEGAVAFYRKLAPPGARPLEI
ncbi:MAG: response regulator [Betaproteobacteria bacterium]|nr:response regulator [Betaproteobacteria bacterium]